jgi:peptidyl-prolyl cis-trans isomerase B (cyclophilin B)
MARTPMPDSASSQFFIVHKDSPHLDGDYACFGYVTEGIEVVDAVCENVMPYDNNGSVAEEDQPVIRSITIRTK